MLYTEYNRLNVIKLTTRTDAIPFETLCDAIQKQPSNVIYCESKGRIYGIISSGDVERSYFADRDYVPVNTNFTYVMPNESMRARKIFFDNAKINTIPVIDENGVLLGDYKRWDKPRIRQISLEVQQFEQINRKAILVRPCVLFREKEEIFREFKAFLLSAGVTVCDIEWNKVLDYIESADEILVVDRDEYWAMRALLIMSGYVDYTDKIRTYENFIQYSYVGTYMCSLRNENIPILNLVFRDTCKSKMFNRKLENKMVSRSLDRFNNKVQQDFFCELYTPEYADSIMKLPFSVSANATGKLKDCENKFCKVINGERYTVGQPDRYSRTIYFVGPCFVYGHFVEDKYTIESFLQKRLNAAKYDVRVVNCGSFYSWMIEKELARIKELPLQKGDIVVVYFDNLSFQGVPELNLMDVLEYYNVEAGWVFENMRHCNHKVNYYYAEAIYNALADMMAVKVEGLGEKAGEDDDVVKTIYIDKYFSDINFEQYKTVGSIVMNCNPFTYGHRYLIEQALRMVEFLIIFVVEEDESLFSFTERFSMVSDGTKDLEHVMVVPSGPFILSKTSFPEYFVKESDEDIVQNTESDITCFAERIAPHLNISYRFVGEEPEDLVTNEYNNAMKKILPHKGITLVEIPRKEKNGSYISGSLVRRCLEEMDMERLKSLVPESTIELLFAEWQ